MQTFFLDVFPISTDEGDTYTYVCTSESAFFTHFPNECNFKVNPIIQKYLINAHNFFLNIFIGV